MIARLTATILLSAACGMRGAPEPPTVPGEPIAIELAHLRALGLDLTVGGRPVRAVALYAEAPDYRPAASPERDGAEGIACVDDAARAAVLYLRRHEDTGDPALLAEARGLLAFVVAMEQGDGEYVNFIRADGTLNTTAPSSAPAFSYWAARALWALGEAARVLGRSEPALAAELRPALDRAVARFGRAIDAGRLVGGSTTATAEALLGLLALEEADPSPERAALAARAVELLARTTRGDAEQPPWGAHVDPDSREWHAWGARAVEATARAAVVLDRPDLARTAVGEARGLWLRLLLAGDMAATVGADGAVGDGAEIAYGVSPIVLGYLALADATGDRRYAALAGIAAGWFLGSNRADRPVYDRATGRVYDGIDRRGAVNLNAGAESTIEGLLALSAVARDPTAAEHALLRPSGAPAGSLVDAPPRRDFTGPGGERVALAATPGGFTLTRGAPVELTYWPGANPVEVAAMRSLVDDWNRDNPDVQVRMQPIPAGRTSEEVLLAAIVARSTPDVCSNITSALLARLHRAGGVVRLDTIPSTAARLAERTSAQMLDPLRLADGGVYAFPWKVNPMMILYNVDLLAAAGVAPPRTHSELLDVAGRLARDTDGDGRLDRWAMWMPLKMSWHERFYDFYPLYLAASGGRGLIEGGQVSFDNPAALAVFDLLRAGFDARVFPRANFSDGRDPFLDGTIAMKMIGPWFLNELERLKISGLRYDAVPVPVPDGMDVALGHTFADMKSIAIFSTTKHPVEAARFVAYLTSPEADRRLVEVTAQLPFRRGLPRDRRFRAALARWHTLDRFADRVERSHDLDPHPDIIEVLDILSEAYEASAIYGVEPTAGALRRAADEARVVTGER